MERKLENVEEWIEKKGRGGQEEGRKEYEREREREEIRRRIRRLDIRQDKRERKGKRNNVVVRRIKVEGRDTKEEIKKLWEKMELRYEGVKEVRKIGKVGKDGRGMVLVMMKSREYKREVMEGTKKLRGSDERIGDDLTEEERRARWKIEREVERERRKGRNVQVGYMKMWVNGKLRRWDEIEEKWLEEQGGVRNGSRGWGKLGGWQRYGLG
ncbi:uncharacterized protein LOC143352486 [Halictus rubicundus]|uniref:uncharacterized protein LOC143352486 n=1 Tax=Halictus rubicundus TaxID=77578 RepID=UPI004036056B